MSFRSPWAGLGYYRDVREQEQWAAHARQCVGGSLISNLEREGRAVEQVTHFDENVIHLPIYPWREREHKFDPAIHSRGLFSFSLSQAC